MKVNSMEYYIGAAVISVAVGFYVTSISIGFMVLGGFIFVAAFLREA